MMRKTNGFTLLESVMAMAISVILLLMLEKFFLAQQKNLQHQLALMTINNKFYFARELLTKAVRYAGFMGCRHLTKVFSEQSPIEVQANSNKIIARSYKPVEQIKKDNKTYLIADCEHAEFIRADQPLQYQYRLNAQLLMFEQNNFYLKKNSLYLQDESGKSDEVISGIDAMEITLEKNMLTIWLILDNDKNIGAMSQTIQMMEQNYSFTDGKLHQLFKINILLREKYGN